VYLERKTFYQLNCRQNGKTSQLFIYVQVCIAQKGGRTSRTCGLINRAAWQTNFPSIKVKCATVVCQWQSICAQTAGPRTLRHQ